jgi:lysophospholipase L1-like esterase
MSGEAGLMADEQGGRRAALVVGAVLAVVVVAVVAWLALRDDDPAEPEAFDSACGTVVRPPQGTDTTTKLLLVGDSIMAQPSCPVATALAPLGVETHMHAIGGSGLLANGDDAQRRFGRLLASVEPDAVAALYVGNYIGPPASDGDGRPIAPDTPEFFAAWQERARELSEAAAGAGAELFWVQPPPVRDSSRAARLFEGYTALGDGTLPSGAVLGGASGAYVDDKPECAGGEPLRDDDGLHLTPAGADVFGRTVAHDLAAALGLPPVPAPC